MGMVDGVERYEGVSPQAEPGWGWHVFYILYTSAESQNNFENYWGGLARYGNNCLNKITLSLFDKELIQFTIN